MRHKDSAYYRTRMFPRPVFVTGVIVVAVLVAIEHAQTPQPRPQFRSGVEYVQVDVRVVDEKGEPVHDLKQQDFKVFEDGAPQDLKTFSIVDLPLPDPSARPLAASLGVKPD